MSIVEAPCYKCTERAVGCHSTCERYSEYASVVAQARERRFEDNMSKANLISAKRQKELAKRQGER